MATTNQIKFYKVQTLPSTLVVGAVYFEVTTQRICVAKTTTEYDAFGVGLKGAALANGVLTITRFDNTTVTVDLNDIASATSVQTALNTINDKINVINGTGEGSIKKAVADEAALREAADSKIREDFAAADFAAAQAAAGEYDAIRGEFAAADATLQTNIDKKADAATTYSKTEVEGLVNVKANAADVYTKTETDAAIKVVSDALAQEVTDRGAAVQGLQDQIDDLEAAAVTVKAADNDKYVAVSKATDSNAYTISSKGIDDAISTAVSAEKSQREAADAELQGAIDTEKARINVLVGDDTGKSVRGIASEEVAKIVAEAPEAYDTLEEIAAWISEHPESVADLNSKIQKNASDIDTVSADLAAEVERSTKKDEAHDEAIKALQEADAAQATLNATLATKSELASEKSALNSLIEANAAAIKTINETTVPGLEERLDGHDADIERIDGVLATLATSDVVTGINNRLTQAEADIDAIKTKNGEQDTAIEAADAKGAQGIADAAAALAEAQAKVASVTSGDAYVSVNNTDKKSPVLSLNVNGSIAEGNTGLVNGGAIFNELCWVEFE